MVTAPAVVDRLPSTHVLTTKWVEGERLAALGRRRRAAAVRRRPQRVPRLLLDTGTLPCDPPPATCCAPPTAPLCILDWGMTLDVPSDLQLALLEFIANLQAEKYDAVPDDLVNLGFVPADRLGARRPGMTYGIAGCSSWRRAAAPKGSMERLVAENKYMRSTARS